MKIIFTDGFIHIMNDTQTLPGKTVVGVVPKLNLRSLVIACVLPKNRFIIQGLTPPIHHARW